MSHSANCPCARPLNHTTCRIAIRYNQQECPFHPSHPPPPHHSIALPAAAPASAATPPQVQRPVRCVVTARRGRLWPTGGGGWGRGEKRGVSVVNWGGGGVAPVGWACFMFQSLGPKGVDGAEENQVHVGFLGRGGHQSPTERDAAFASPRRRRDPNRTWFYFYDFLNSLILLLPPHHRQVFFVAVTLPCVCMMPMRPSQPQRCFP